MRPHLATLRAGLVPVFILSLLAGCGTGGCNEFDPPPDRVPTSCGPKTGKTPVASETAVKHYCYATLGGQSDCYTTPQPGRPNPTGTYGGGS
jgi:hypothetical protein